MIVFILILLAIASPAWAAPTFDTAAQDWTETTASVAVDITIGGGCSNSVVIAWVTTLNGGEAVHSSVGATAGALTAITSSALSYYDAAEVAWIQISGWYRVGVSGTQTVTATIDQPVTEATLTLLSYCGVNQATALGTAITEANGDAAIDISSSSSELVIDAITTRQQSATLTEGGGQTKHDDWNSHWESIGVSDKPGIATTTMSWTQNGDYFVHAAVALKGTTTTLVRHKVIVLQ